MKKPEKFEIDRGTWLRGGMPSVLMDKEGHKCCLGFYALECGAKEEDIRGYSVPSSVFHYRNHIEIPELLDTDVDDDVPGSTSSSALACSLMKVNDDALMDPEERERRITAKFAEIGVEVTFTGE